MELAGARILVTGGAGFLGSHLCPVLLDGGAQVTVVDNLSTGQSGNLTGSLERLTLVEQDMRHESFFDWLRTRRFDAVVHLAANGYLPPSVRDPQYDFETNAVVTFRLLECLRTMPDTRLINASTAAVYGDPINQPITETDPTVPLSPYGVSKLAAERYVDVYARLFGLRTASLRFFPIYGPRLRKQIVFDIIGKLQCNRHELEVLGDGTQVRDLNYASDAVSAILMILAHAPMHGEVYNAASGHSYTTSEIVRSICDAMGLHPRLHYTDALRPGDSERWSAAFGPLAALGYAPEVSLPEGIRRTVAWYRMTYGDDPAPEA
jgi:UDP-glucose 4-epimerase